MAPIDPKIWNEDENIKELLNTLKKLSKEVEDLKIDESDFISNIEDEISKDMEECREMAKSGQNMLWKYKDFESEEHLNRWLKEFSKSIIEIQPSVNERLGFYVKLSTQHYI